MSCEYKLPPLLFFLFLCILYRFYKLIRGTKSLHFLCFFLRLNQISIICANILKNLKRSKHSRTQLLKTDLFFDFESVAEDSKGKIGASSLFRRSRTTINNTPPNLIYTFIFRVIRGFGGYPLFTNFLWIFSCHKKKSHDERFKGVY